MDTTNSLHKLPQDPRDIKLGDIYDLPKLEELPDEFTVAEPLKVRSQRNDDSCSGHGTAYMSEVQEEIPLHPRWTWAWSKRDNPDEWGQDLRSMFKAHVKVGAPEERLTDTQSRYFKDYAEDLQENAFIHRKRAFAMAQGGYLPFDNMRAYMWKYRANRPFFGLGLRWNYPVSQIKIENYAQHGTGHFVTMIGWVGDYAKILNSYGKKAGDNGIHLIHKSVINHWVDYYGAGTFVDLDPKELKATWSWWQKVYNLIVKLLKNLV